MKLSKGLIVVIILLIAFSICDYGKYNLNNAALFIVAENITYIISAVFVVHFFYRQYKKKKRKRRVTA